jgi:tetratricopeptide (TPR) repeat protein
MGRRLLDILKHMEVPTRRGVFLLGCFERRVTLYSQQVRALNLVHALFEHKRLRPGSRLVVVGAGAGGLTVAAGAALCGCEVTVLEQGPSLLPLLANNRTRWLHPHIYDWPTPGAESPSAGLPLLDWKAGKVFEVVEQLRTAWELLRQKHGISVHLGAEDVTPAFDSKGDLERIGWNDPEGNTAPRPVDALVLAVGFGVEPQEPEQGLLSYWQNDDLAQDIWLPPGGKARILVSGTGDGGLVDLFRAVLRDFDHERVVRELLNPLCPESLKEELLAIEEELQDGRVRVDALSVRYANLKVPPALDTTLRERRRQGMQVVLNGMTVDPLSTGASVLNRFLASRLRAPYRSGKLGKPKRVGAQYEVKIGTRRPERFDRLVIRHGPRPTLEQDFPWLPKDALAKMRARSELDQTRERLWPDDAFGGGPPPRPPEPKPSLFIGRELLLKQLVGALLEDKPRVMSVSGAPGVGKSRLLLEAFHDARVAKWFEASRYFIRAEGLRDEDSMFSSLAKALGVAPGPDLKSRVISALSGGSVLLVLDGLESVDPNGGGYLVEQLARIEGLTLVFSGRNPPRPRMPRELLPFEVPPLDPSSGRELLRMLLPQVDLSDPWLGELLEHHAGEALYIQLLASHAKRQLSRDPGPNALRELWQSLHRELHRPAADGATSEEVNTLIAHTLHGSQLKEETRRLLSVLAYLPAGAARADLERLISGAGPTTAVELVETGLAYVDENARYHVLASIRDFVRASLPARPEELARAVAHYGGFASLLGPKVGGPEGAAAIERLRPEVENIEAMFLKGLSRPEARRVIDQVLDSNNFWRFSGHGSFHVVSRAREVARQLGDVLREALCLQVEGQLALDRSLHQKAELLFREALPLFERIDPEHTEKQSTLGYARCVRGVGAIALDGQRLDEAEDCFRRALQCFEKVGSPLSEANCVHSLGKVALDRGHLEQARTRFEEARRLFDRLGDRLGSAHCLRSLGDLDASPSLLDEARLLFSQVGNHRGQAHCLRGLGDLALKRGECDDAQALYLQARSLLKQVGSLRGEANCLLGLGRVALQRSEPAVARVHFEEAARLFERVSDARSLAQCQQYLNAQ